MHKYLGGPYFGYFRMVTQAGAHLVRNKLKKYPPSFKSLTQL